jgi:Ankyrin repeats (many copies)
MVRPPRLRDHGGSSSGTTTSYLVESRDFEGSQRGGSVDDDESYDADTSGSATEEEEEQRRHSHNDYGVELVLNRTTDSQRARDMIVSSRRRRSSPSPYHDATTSTTTNSSSKRNNEVIVETVDSQSVASSTGDSRASSSQRPRHAIDSATTTATAAASVSSRRSDRSRFMREQIADAASVTSKSVDSRASSSRALFDDTSEASSAASGRGGGLLYPLKEGDTIWRAAKRGDLAALKRFHSQGKVDWAATDQFGNTALFYACHSGAIVDINVLHFLLWVTPMKEVDLEACKNRKNKAVMKILHEFEGSGYSSPFQQQAQESSLGSASSKGRQEQRETVSTLVEQLPA